MSICATGRKSRRWKLRPSGYSRPAASSRKPAPAPRQPRAAAPRQSPGEAMVNSALRSLGTQLGRQIARGILGAIMKR